MIPSIVVWGKEAEMVGGGMTYAKNMAELFGVDLTYFNEGNDFQSKADYTILAATLKFSDIVGNIGRFPKPIICIAHDITHFEYIGREIRNYIDGYVTSTAEAYKHVSKDTKLVHFSRIPFISRNKEIDFSKKTRPIVSNGRIVPERGHRYAAEFAMIGYDVTIAGSSPDHEEFVHYRNKLERMGAVIEKNLSNEDMARILDRSKIVLSYCFTFELFPPVYYALLEAIDHGCYPVVPYWVARAVREAGLICSAADSAQQANVRVQYILDNFDSQRTDLAKNKMIVERWSDTYVDEMNEFAGRL